MTQSIFSEDEQLVFKVFESFKPKVYKDGDKWCCLYGDNLQDGIAGFGQTPANAAHNFWLELYKH